MKTSIYARVQTGETVVSKLKFLRKTDYRFAKTAHSDVAFRQDPIGNSPTDPARSSKIGVKFDLRIICRLPAVQEYGESWCDLRSVIRSIGPMKMQVSAPASSCE